MNRTLNLEKHVIDAYEWIDEIGAEIGEQDRQDQPYHALKGVLVALRDRVMPEELFQLSAQLPLLIRGILFEGYRLAGKPEKYHADEFLDRITSTMGPTTKITPEKAFGAVLRVLYRRISEGELEDIHASMPADIQRLWEEQHQSLTM